MSFFSIAHANENINQAFSKASEQLEREDTATPDFHSVFKCAYTGCVREVHMKLTVHWSGLCSQEQAAQRVLSFSLILYFSFRRSRFTTSPGSKVSCFVESKGCEKWASQLCGSRSSEKGFQKFTPDLWRTTTTVAFCPSGNEKIRKRLHSQEQEINETLKMRALYGLRDCIYADRQLPFH